MSVPRRGGRPPKPEALRKSEVVLIRLTPQEADRLWLISIHRGIPLSDVIRERLGRLLGNQE